jgi:hypothetical protein
LDSQHERRAEIDRAERIAQVVRDDREDLFAKPDGILGLAIEPRILDRDTGATAELTGQLEIGSAIAPPRLRGREGQRAERVIVRDQRDGDHRFQAACA